MIHIFSEDWFVATVLILFKKSIMPRNCTIDTFLNFDSDLIMMMIIIITGMSHSRSHTVVLEMYV